MQWRWLKAPTASLFTTAGDEVWQRRQRCPTGASGFGCGYGRRYSHGQRPGAVERATFTGAVLFPTTTVMFANTSGGWTGDWVARNNYAYGGAGSSYVGARVRSATATAPRVPIWWSTMRTAGRRTRRRPACMLRSGNAGINDGAGDGAGGGHDDDHGRSVQHVALQRIDGGRGGVTTVSAPSGYTTVSGSLHVRIQESLAIWSRCAARCGARPTVTTLMTLPAGIGRRRRGGCRRARAAAALGRLMSTRTGRL